MSHLSFPAYEYLAYPPAQPIGRQLRQLTSEVQEAALLLVNVYGLCLAPTSSARKKMMALFGAREVARREQIAQDCLTPAARHARQIGMPVIYAADSAPRIDLGKSRFGEIQRDHLGYDPETAFAENCNDPHEYQAGTSGLIEYAPEIAPQGDDYYIRKWVYSAFYLTWLDRLLRNLGTKTLFCAGFNGDSDLWCTMLEGQWLGYRILLLSDGFAAVDIPAAEPVMPFTQRLAHYAENCLGYTCTSAHFVEACKEVR